MKLSRWDRNRAMRVIHDARDANPGMLLEPSDLKEIKNLEETLVKLRALDLLELQYADDRIYYLELSDAGLVYFETKSDEFWRFVRRSILVPIGISFLTTGLAWCIKFLITGTWL